MQVQTSCGYGVPLLAVTPLPEGGKFAAIMNDRDTLANWADNTIEKGQLGSYQAEWNSGSLDGLPGMRSARLGNGERLLWVGDKKAWLKRAAASWDTLLFGIAVGAMVGVVGTRSFLGRF